MRTRQPDQITGAAIDDSGFPQTLKIALVTNEFYPFRGGGIGTYCESQCRALVAKGHEVHVITSVHGPDQVYGATVHRCKIPYNTPAQAVPARHKKSGLGFGDKNYLASYAWAEDIKRIVETYGIELIECQECMAPLYYYMYNRLLDIDARHVPVVIHLHTPSYEIALWDRRPVETPEMHMLRYMEDFCISMADAVLSPSSFLAEHISSRLPEIKAKLEVIPYPAYEQTANVELIEKKDSYKEIVFVGRLEHRKGIEILVNALLEIMENRKDVKVRFIGKSMYSHVRGMHYRDWVAGKLSGFSGRVIFDGLLDRTRILSRMQAADCVVIPSVGENFPNVCMEAMLSGSVIIASDTGGMAEMMGEEGGFLFEGSNVGSLVKTVEMVLSLPEPASRKTRESAKARIRDYCDIEKIIGRRIRHYQTILARSANNRPRVELPAHLFCGNHYVKEAEINEVNSVTAVILDNGNDSIRNTLNSLLASRRKPDEILVVSYGPKRTDLHRDLTSNLPVKTRQIWTMSNNIAEIKNFAIDHVLSDAVFFLHNTDMVRQEFIDVTVSILNRHPRTAYIQSWIKCASHVASPIAPFFPYCLYNNCFVTPNGMIRLVALKQTNGYQTGLNFHYLDWQIILAFMEKGWVSIVTDRILVEANLPDYKKREELEVGVGNIMYQQLVMNFENLFDNYKHEVLIAAGSQLSMSGIYLTSRMSAFERKLLGVLLEMYRMVRNKVETNIASIPYLKKLLDR